MKNLAIFGFLSFLNSLHCFIVPSHEEPGKFSKLFGLSNKSDLVWFIVFNATFNNISAISWQSVLLVEETGIPA